MKGRRATEDIPNHSKGGFGNFGARCGNVGGCAEDFQLRVCVCVCVHAHARVYACV